MSKGRDRTVFKRPDGQWANKRNDGDRASSVHHTQAAAEKAAREMLKNQGGGELTTKGENGKPGDLRGRALIRHACNPLGDGAKAARVPVFVRIPADPQARLKQTDHLV